MDGLQDKIMQVKQEIKKVIIGKDEVIDAILMTLMAG